MWWLPVDERTGSTVITIVISAAIGAAVTLGGWSLARTFNHEARISVLEETTFTSEGAALLQRDLERTLNDLKNELKSSITDVKECLIRHDTQSPCE